MKVKAPVSNNSEFSSPVTTNGHSAGVNGNGATQVNGNGAHANGNGAHANGNGAHANGNANGASKRILRVVVPRGNDDNACVRLLEQLHVLVERCAGGADELQLVLHDRAGGQIALANTDIAVKHTPELESQVRTLVGAWRS